MIYIIKWSCERSKKMYFLGSNNWILPQTSISTLWSVLLRPWNWIIASEEVLVLTTKQTYKNTGWIIDEWACIRGQCAIWTSSFPAVKLFQTLWHPNRKDFENEKSWDRETRRHNGPRNKSEKFVHGRCNSAFFRLHIYVSDHLVHDVEFEALCCL